MVKCCICGVVFFHTLQSSAFAPPSVSFSMTARTNTAGKLPYPEDIASVYHHMDNVDKKRPAILGPTAFAASALLGVPFWCTVLLPFTVFSTAVNLLWVLLRGPKNSPASIDEFHHEKEQNANITPMNSRKYDLVLLGVSGFTGKLAATYLAKQYCVGTEAKLKWAVAGRSKKKIESTLKSISEKLGCDQLLQVDVIIVDTSQRDTVREMVDSTRTVITTAGPFMKYGTCVVELCAKYGTHYADITGEVQWNKAMMKQYESIARETGAKLVSFCGHDSIPWDLTVRLLSEKLREAGEELVSVECLNEAMGGVSGGTIATFFESLDRGFDEVKLSTLASKESGLDVYMRLPDGSESKSVVLSDLPLAVSPCKNPSLRFLHRWSSPSVMAFINFEIVRRGVALSRSRSKTLKYREAIVTESFMDAFTMWFGQIMLGTLIVNPVTRPFMKMILPEPGHGPSEKEMEDGFLCVTGYGVGTNGTKAQTVMYFPQDGGYSSTARMLVESGLCLSLDSNKHDFVDGGFYSPSALMCHALLDRLLQNGTHFACKLDVEK
ncbi:hypothetical protein HJC23_012086 [Cyclotella cryptica]|uniref:Saccharopine dehydrogenase NADP binding domain-containing protein n=1 Tax=Cyclotella cryptica TaxID=29204 RepID=A0ABD3PUQ5_9STRA